MSGAAVIDDVRAHRFGFFTAAEIAAVAADDQTRLTLLLVRCGACRFLAPAQDVAKLIAAVELAGDYIRDVSLPAREMR